MTLGTPLRAMNHSRRSFLRVAAVLTPAVILTPGLLMKVKVSSRAPSWHLCAFDGVGDWVAAPDGFFVEGPVIAVRNYAKSSVLLGYGKV